MLYSWWRGRLLGKSAASAILIETAADILSHDFLRHHLVLDDENEGGGGGGGARGVGISAGGGGGGASVAEKVKRYLVAKGYSRAVGGAYCGLEWVISEG